MAKQAAGVTPSTFNFTPRTLNALDAAMLDAVVFSVEEVLAISDMIR